MNNSQISARLSALGLKLPMPGAPQGSYVPYKVTSGGLVFVAGQGPRIDGKLLYAGKVGSERTIEEGYEAAKLSALNLLAHLSVACDGDFSRVRQVVRVAGLVNCSSDFHDHPKVINGASDLLYEVFGESGAHARIASGAGSLPSDMTVEVEACFELEHYLEI